MAKTLKIIRYCQRWQHNANGHANSQANVTSCLPDAKLACPNWLINAVTCYTMPASAGVGCVEGHKFYFLKKFYLLGRVGKFEKMWAIGRLAPAYFHY